MVKKDKNNAYWKQYNKVFNRNKEKTKFYNPLSSTNQPQTQASNSKKQLKKEQGRGHPATEVNATKVVKKDKDKVKDLSYVKCYTCKQKSLYVNKYPVKPKN